MIFSSLEYLFGFLPVVLLVYLWLNRHTRAALGWLIVCSLFFYAWWEPVYLLLLLASIAANYLIAGRLEVRGKLEGAPRAPRVARSH